jgi:hypothetical protein
VEKPGARPGLCSPGRGSRRGMDCIAPRHTQGSSEKGGTSERAPRPVFIRRGGNVSFHDHFATHSGQAQRIRLGALSGSRPVGCRAGLRGAGGVSPSCRPGWRKWTGPYPPRTCADFPPGFANRRRTPIAIRTTGTVVLPLQRCEGHTPPGLEQEIADLVGRAIPGIGPATLDEYEWQPADDAEPLSKAVVIEPRLRHVSDQIEAENPRRVEERDRAPSAAKSAAAPLTEGTAPGQPSPADLDELKRRIAHQVQICLGHGVHVRAAVRDASLSATPGRPETGGGS